MRKSTKNFVEDLLRDYPRISDYIKEKKEQIKYPFHPYEEYSDIIPNKAPNAEHVALKIDDCEFIHSFKYQELAIDNALKNFDDDFIAIINEFYFTRHNNKPISIIAEEHGYTNTCFYKNRTKLFEDILFNMGCSHYVERDKMLANG